MNRFRLLAIATMLMFALSVPAQQTAVAPGEKPDQGQNAAPAGMPTVDQHLKVLSDKLDLTAEQQAEIRPILQQMQDSFQKIRQDTSLSDQERHDRMKAVHAQADKQARPILNDEQKKKLDELEQEPHGHPNGAAQPSR
jgi:Spy/CpxP family protein refolding chaperone